MGQDKMKVLLVCPSNTLFMPYLENYTTIFSDNNISYDTLLWNRFGYEERAQYQFTDKKKGHRRNLFDYIKFGQYVKKILDNSNYDKIIIFGLQTLFFVQNKLMKNYRGEFIVDIRDYHPIAKCINFTNLNKSIITYVVSSEGYLKLLKGIDNATINHNSNIKKISDIEFMNPINNRRISIGCIGALRDAEINLKLIKYLLNNSNFQLNFNGEGVINNQLIKLVDSYNANNVNVSGTYEKNEEEGLYKKNTLINVLRFNDSNNNKVALPNRLYKSIQYGIPLLAFKGTYLAEIIEKYQIGLVIESFDKIDSKIIEYIDSLDSSFFHENQIKFFEKVISDNESFKNILISNYKIKKT